MIAKMNNQEKREWFPEDFVKESKDSYLFTYSGLKFFVFDPKPYMVNIADIAHALSNICRFNGHTNRFYSVAEHCLYVSELLPKELQLGGLLHDAAEAYISDLPRPIKQFFNQYKEVENKILKTIFECYNVDFPLDDKIKEADNTILEQECIGLFNGGRIDTIKQTMLPHEVKAEFLKMFYWLMNEK